MEGLMSESEIGEDVAKDEVFARNGNQTRGPGSKASTLSGLGQCSH